MSLLQVAGFDPENPENKQAWVIDLLDPQYLSPLADKNTPTLSTEEYKKLIVLVLDEIIGNVTSTKLGIGLANDVQNLKIACEYQANKKIVNFHSYSKF